MLMSTHLISFMNIDRMVDNLTLNFYIWCQSTFIVPKLLELFCQGLPLTDLIWKFESQKFFLSHIRRGCVHFPLSGCPSAFRFSFWAVDLIMQTCQSQELFVFRFLLLLPPVGDWLATYEQESTLGLLQAWPNLKRVKKSLFSFISFPILLRDLPLIWTSLIAVWRLFVPRCRIVGDGVMPWKISLFGL